MRKSSAERLVRKLAELGYVVEEGDYFIDRDYGQSMKNEATGECAPTWALAVRVGYAGRSDPVVRFPDGSEWIIEVSSHLPLLHILRTPLSEWEIWVNPEGQRDRLTILTNNNPKSWGVDIMKLTKVQRNVLTLIAEGWKLSRRGNDVRLRKGDVSVIVSIRTLEALLRKVADEKVQGC